MLSSLLSFLLLHSAEEKTIPAKGKALIDTQLSIAVPEGTYGRVAPRSGLGEWRSIRMKNRERVSN